jgi:hypothetical protein
MIGYAKMLIAIPSAPVAQNPMLAAVFCPPAKHDDKNK